MQKNNQNLSNEKKNSHLSLKEIQRKLRQKHNQNFLKKKVTEEQKLWSEDRNKS